MIESAKSGNQDAYFLLFKNYNAMIKSIVRRFYLIGFDLEDLYQEGLIGFYGAISTFTADKNTSFSSFAYLCVKRSVIDAIKKNNSQKNKSHFDCLNINFQGEVSDGDNVKSVLASPCLLPDDELINKETIEEIISYSKNNMSRFENQVLNLFLQGLSYKEIAENLNKDLSSVENGLSRLRKKLIAYFKK